MRICSWNIQLGGRLDGVLEAIETEPSFQSVDVVALQEASVHGGITDAAAVAARLGSGFDHFQARAQTWRGFEQANAVVWRRLALGPTGGPHVLPLPGSPTLEVGRSERMLLRVVPPQTRIALRFETPDVRVYVVHLDVVGFAHKLEQFRAVLADMQARPPVRLTVVAGDLNTFGPGRPQLWRRLASAAASSGLVNVTAHVRRTHWTGQKLDAIYAASSARMRHRAWTVGTRASDHLPVFAEIEMAA